ncbi:MAG: AAA family ATPase [Candidatus Pacearchaeota archaeon]
MTKIIGIISFKGGVGKTISVINIGAALSKLNKKVLVVDANFLSPTLHIYLGLLNPDITLREAIRNNILPEDAIYEHKSGLNVMPCNFYKDADLEKFKKIIDYVKEKYDYVIVDSGPSYSEEILGVLMVADEMIFITTPDYPTLTTTLRAAELVKQKKLPIIGIIVNKKRKKSYELTSKDIERTTSLPVISEINDDHKIMISVSKFNSIINQYPRNKNSKNYLRIAKEIIGDEEEIKKLSNELKKIGLS